MSSRMDWPPAPAISCIFAAILVGSAVIGNIALARNRASAAAKFVGIAAALIGMGFGLTTFLRSDLAWSMKTHANEPTAEAHSHGPPEHALGGSRADLIAALADEHEQVRAAAAEQLGKLNDPSVVVNLARALDDSSAAVKEKAAQALGALGRPEAATALEAALAKQDQDEWVNLHEAEALVRCGGARGMSALITMAGAADAKLVRVEALRKALAFAGTPEIAHDGAAAETARAQVASWWQANLAQARWDKAAQRFAIVR
jgi:hypothetical protein